MEIKKLKDLKVLLVEDSQTQALLLKEALEENQLKVSIARDGIEGLKFLKSESPQVIISDIEMPNMNGFEFCQNVRKNKAFDSIPIILLTTLSDAMHVIKGIDCGADSFLTKPSPIYLLLSTISDALENKSLNERMGEDQKMDFCFEGIRHQLQVNYSQITSLLLSTYVNAIQKNHELELAYRKLNLIHHEVEKNNDDLQRLNTEKNHFLGMAAHDLRNPLTVIQGYSSLLMDKLSTVNDQGYLSMLERIQRSSTFMLGMINELLDISIIESGQVRLNLSEIDFYKLVKDDVSISKGLAEKKQINVEFKGDEKIPKVTCDPNKMEQVINNLISNAIKYSNPGSTIEISLTSNATEVILAVKDQGIGIPVDMQQRLFQPFIKGMPKGTNGEMSSGLGLTIVKKIVQEHKGRIWFESIEGKGSTFFVALPYKN